MWFLCESHRQLWGQIWSCIWDCHMVSVPCLPGTAISFHVAWILRNFQLWGRLNQVPIKEFAHPGKERRLQCPSTSSWYRDRSNVYIKVMPLSQSMKIKICKHVLLFLLVFFLQYLTTGSTEERSKCFIKRSHHFSAITESIFRKMWSVYVHICP